MADAAARIRELRALDSLSAKNTAIHKLHPLAKLLSAIVFIIIVASFGRCDFARLSPYLFYPFVMMALAELPYKLILARMLVALPFCLFAGISNVIFDRETAFVLGSVAVSYGVLSLLTILLKMYLCVMAALILAATMPLSDLSAQLRRLRIPAVLVMVFETTFRYIGVLFEESHSMTTAYRLRSRGRKAIELRHMGPFTGHLLLRGFARAERVYAAMSCRGYSLEKLPASRRRLRGSDAAALAAVCLPSLLLRFLRIL